MCAKFWPNNKAAQPDRFPNHVVYDCFSCDEAYIGDIQYCPKCNTKLYQLFPFWGTGVQQCLVAGGKR